MKIHFLGVGEACDEGCPNTSLLVTSEKGQRFLLDCGFTTPHLYFASCLDPDELDVVWISHFHGDHFFGIPLLLLRFWEMGRRRNLVIAGPRSVGKKVSAAMELAYPDFLPRLRYSIDFVEIAAGESRILSESHWRAAANRHSQYCLAVCVDDGEHRLFYSGDGRPTAETLSLAQGCSLVVHEAFMPEDEVENHGSVAACIEFAVQSGVKNLALVHIRRNCRESVKKRITELQGSMPCHIFIPESGNIFVL